VVPLVIELSQMTVDVCLLFKTACLHKAKPLRAFSKLEAAGMKKEEVRLDLLKNIKLSILIIYQCSVVLVTYPYDVH
jgi:hypothetical protein